MQEIIRVSTTKYNILKDITKDVESVVNTSLIKTRLIHVYVQGTMAGIMIQKNWDDSVQNDYSNRN